MWGFKAAVPSQPARVPGASIASSEITCYLGTSGGTVRVSYFKEDEIEKG